jgi:hypothetical protein
MKPRGTKSPRLTITKALQFIAGRPGAYMLQFRHYSWCPGATNGTGQGCICKPDVRLVSVASGREVRL